MGLPFPVKLHLYLTGNTLIHYGVFSYQNFCKNIKIIYIYQTFERRNFNVYLGIFVIVSDPTELLSIKTYYFVEIHEKITRGANKSLIIHKTSQNNRNNII